MWHPSSSQLGQGIVFGQTDACETENEIVSFSSFVSPDVHKFSSQEGSPGADVLEGISEMEFQETQVQGKKKKDCKAAT